MAASSDSDPDDFRRGGTAASRSRAEWVYDSLRNAIQAGRYARGERVREEEIARSLGVSRTPVREALARLQVRGLLEMAPAGLVVAELSRAQTVELYSMREILEGSAARFAAQHAAPGEIGALHRLSAEFEASVGDPSRLAHLNREFHDAIHEAAHNRYLTRTLNELHDALTLLPSTTFEVAGRPELAVVEHRLIVEAIERRDPDAAEQAARDHIRRAQETRLEMMFRIR